jgi:ceramide glucosyltransferase
VNFTNAIPAALALLSLALVLWQWLGARRFPLHQRIAGPSFAPAITLLKPLKSRDETTAGSLQSWFNQHYPGPTQILFGVADAGDPVCKIVNELIRRNPGHDAQLVVCSESLGTNGKISTLIQLERLAKYELILIGDADVRVPADFLAGIVVPLRDDKTALVS